jgi:quinoprotein glucose dehydrogenase
MSKVGGPLGVMLTPGRQGGTNWPGGAYDPETHRVFVFSETAIDVRGVIPNNDPNVSDMKYIGGAAGAKLTPPRGMAMGAPPPPEGGGPQITVRGLPLLKPPYGRITAIDLSKGEIAWQVAHGETPDSIRNSPELKGITIPRTGRLGLLGPLATKSLVICGDSGIYTLPSGVRGAMLRAYDKMTGKEVGAVFIDAPQSGSPMTYLLNGEQYLVLAISGANYSGELVAFKLPAN